MTAPNHVAGGIVITGIAGSFMGINVLSSPWYLAVVVFASILPDIDHTKSLIGKVFFPISRYINRKWGHRTITHSLMFLVLMTMIANLVFMDGDMVTLFGIGYVSHLFLDMITIQGVPLFYPFMKNSFVLPGDRSYRLSTGNLRQEGMFFSFMMLSGLWLQPLMESGFWTQYNRTFATTNHLVSEFHKSDDLLRVDWTIKDGIEEKKGWGWCVEATENRVVLVDSILNFRILDNSKVFIKEVVPSHTDMKMIFREEYFEGVGVDSLNRMMKGKLMKEVLVNCNNKFLLNHEKVGKLNGKYLKNLNFGDLDIDYKEERFEWIPNPRIKSLSKKIAALESKSRVEEIRYKNESRELLVLEASLKNESDLYERDKIRKSISQFGKIKEVKNYESEILDLKNEIRELKSLDRIEKSEKKFIFETKMLESRPLPSRFSGKVEFVYIS